jgi:hypothetical protein
MAMLFPPALPFPRGHAGDELRGVGVVAEPAGIGAVRHPHHAFGIDLRIAQALTIGRRGAGRRIDFGELEGLGVEVPQFAGALRHPGIALGIDRDIVGLGMNVGEVVLHGTVVHGLAGQHRPRQPAVGVIGLHQREFLRQIIDDRGGFRRGQIGNACHRHARAHAADGVIPVVGIGSLDDDALQVVA